ncbi:MAG: M23 family metallopeptidase [Candidatus Korobacteraceae bacterium]
MRRQLRIPHLIVFLLLIVSGAPCSFAQGASLPILTFPLKADVKNQDQHLTSSTAKANSVFDHSMLDSRTLYSIYGCDDVVVAFTGTVARFGPGIPIITPGCNDGYKVLNILNPPPISLAPNMYYWGWADAKYLFYDGHPGIDYQAAMDTQVYAALSGTIHYPSRIVGLGYPAPAYHVMEIVPDHAQGSVPPYLIYYLHLDTYVGQQQIPINDPDPLPGCPATVYLPLNEGTHVQAGCLVALSGKAAPPIYNFMPHLHLEVQRVVPSFMVFNRFGARTADACVDGVLGVGYDCVPVDPYGWTGAATYCDPQTGLADSGDPYYCLTGVTSIPLWR